MGIYFLIIRHKGIKLKFNMSPFDFSVIPLDSCNYKVKCPLSI